MADEDEESEEEVVFVPRIEPPYGTVEWIHWWSIPEGTYPSPINVSITGSITYECPELKWYNFDVFPHKVKMTNTGYSVLIGPKWKAERPYLLGGPFLEKHVLGQIHFHWGPNMMSGSDHSVDGRSHPAEMQVSFFKSEYITQHEALQHDDGVIMFCYIIKFGVNPDPRLAWVIEGFPRIKEATTHTKIGPRPMSHLIPMFTEDYFLYWGSLPTAKGENFAIRWLVPRKTLFADEDQIRTFRKIWDPWDEPNMGNNRPIQPQQNRHVFFIKPHWNLYNTLLPTPREPDPSISIISDEYKRKLWMFTNPLNASLVQAIIAEKEKEAAEVANIIENNKNNFFNQ